MSQPTTEQTEANVLMQALVGTGLDVLYPNRETWLEVVENLHTQGYHITNDPFLITMREGYADPIEVDLYYLNEILLHHPPESSGVED